MVQRKAPNKLCIQTDLHVKSEKRLGNLRPSSPKYQDGKNKGSDLKKKMKKSRSIKHTDFESLKSHTSIREVSQPGKPPPPLAVSTPQKQSPVKGSEASPNYMKSTSSFEARKERSQVSFNSSQSSMESKNPKKTSNNSRLSSVSGQKPGKPPARTSSLELVRTLTKSPSFKPVRGSTKKRSQVVLCENLEVQRATCSSTLKDSKFPTYLTLSPGATELEGTSAMKVCPYTYCSLNGHRHAPSPPLKCFLKARRRLLKAQKSMKLGCLSPRRVKEISKRIVADVPAIQGTDSNGPEITQMVPEDLVDFFIQIYTGNMKDAAGKIGGREENGDDMEEVDFDEDGGGKVVERGSNEEWCYEMNSEDSLCNSGEVVLPELEAAEEVYLASPAQEEEAPESMSDGTDSDMEWEEGQHSSTPSPNDEMGNSSQTNNEYDLETGSSSGDDIVSFCKESVFKSDSIVSQYFDEIPAGEGLEEFFEGESSDSDGSNDNLGSDESLEGFNNQNYLLSLTNGVEGDSTTEGRGPIEEASEAREEETHQDYSSSDRIENYHREEMVVESLLPKTEDPETKQSLKQEFLAADAGDATEDEDQEDAAKSWIRIPSFDLSQDFSGADKDMTKEDTNEIQFGAAAKEGELNQIFISEALQNNNDDECQNKSEKDHREAGSLKISHSMISEDQTHSGLNKVTFAENITEDVDEMEVGYSTISDPEETLPSSKNAAITRAKPAFIRGGRYPSEEMLKAPNNLKIIRCKRSDEELVEPREFNPRDPNYLTVEPDPEAEKVDLRHQMMDERKNSEEWMLDYALQQTVFKLAPARKRKVALLVEAFEKVIPTPKYEAHLGEKSPVFAHARPIQACS
ncbi:hypothetical protein RHGRI_019641 [Rhododendron griersonianum]|uniref:Calmodulin-binding domain-containing protein n=1 Tax=Rhododendron griersonianum TaxID=479676 RepID=A0AAV6JD79_9ERIC|nr:hypothetical protein RHGRI_019641 [Rhododendron griersonianum]